MTDYYVQKLDISVQKKEQIKHIAGTVLKLIALGLILVAVFASYYVFIAVGVLFVVGVVLSQIYNNNAKEYEYDFNTARLVICRTNMLGRRERKLEVLFDDVIEFCAFTDLIENDDLVFCQSASDPGVYKLTFTFENKECRLLFQPDNYLVALIKEVLSSLKSENRLSSTKERTQQ